MGVREQAAMQLRAYARRLMSLQRKTNAVEDMERRNAAGAGFVADRRRRHIDCAALAMLGVALLAVGVIVGRLNGTWMLVILCAGSIVAAFALADAVMLAMTRGLVGRAAIDGTKAETLMRSRTGDDSDRAAQSQHEADMTRALFSGQARSEEQARQLTKIYTFVRHRESDEYDRLAELRRQGEQAANEYQSVVAQIDRLRDGAQLAREQEAELRHQNKLLETFVGRRGWSG